MASLPIRNTSNTGNGHDMYFLNPDSVDVLTGMVRIEGVLVQPVGYATDVAIKTALTELADVQRLASPTEAAIATAEDNVTAAFGGRSLRYERHEWIYDIHYMAINVLRNGLANDVDERIAQMERDGSPTAEVKFLKNSRKISRDGSLVAAIDNELSRMATSIAISGVLRRPRTWPGYGIGLVAHAIQLLTDTREMMEMWHEEVEALGVDLASVRQSTQKHWQELISEGTR